MLYTKSTTIHQKAQEMGSSLNVQRSISQGRPSPNSHDATIPLPSPLIPFNKEIVGIENARGWVLDHFGHKIQHFYEPGFWL